MGVFPSTRHFEVGPSCTATEGDAQATRSGGTNKRSHEAIICKLQPSLNHALRSAVPDATRLTSIAIVVRYEAHEVDTWPCHVMKPLNALPKRAVSCDIL